VKVLVVGAGGREHALCWKLAQSPQVDKVFVAPGNAGCAAVAERVDIQPSQIDSLVSFVHSNDIELTVVGPEGPLCLGLVDRLRKLGHKAFGPTQAVARLEGSKSYAKTLAREHNIPGPDFKTLPSRHAAISYLDRLEPKDYPLVIKADGLAAGKGVRICADRIEAEEHILDCTDRSRFGDAGKTIVIEEFIKGREVSIVVITGGQTLIVLDPAQDYKAAYEGNQGPNTGGMGAFSPVDLDEKTLCKIEEKVLIPTLHGLAREGHSLFGVLYAGLMLTPTGPRLLEYNVRFGDPETQPTLVRLKTDLFELFMACVDDRLDEIKVEWDERAAVTVVMTSSGYPGPYTKGHEIRGIADAESDPDVVVFHAGTALRAEKVVTNGGRVLNVTALGETLEAAREKAYAAVAKIKFNGAVYRTDIAAL
jgi:phosphoribosylamine---glycine ligase